MPAIAAVLAADPGIALATRAALEALAYHWPIPTSMTCKSGM